MIGNPSVFQTPNVPDVEPENSPLPPKPPTDPNKAQRKYRNSRLMSGNSVDESTRSVKTLSLSDGKCILLQIYYIGHDIMLVFIFCLF